MSAFVVTRRRALQTTLATALLGGLRNAPGQVYAAPSRWLLIGDNQGQGIYRAAWNPSTGEIGAIELVVATPQPTFLAPHPHLPVLYACNESDTPATASVSAFRLDRLRAQLTPLGTQRTQGSAPCYASVDRTGRLLFAANYGGGSLTVFPLDHDGVPGPAATVFECTGGTLCGTGGPVKERQSSAHLHCAVLSPENRFILACDLGDDAILAFPLHAHTSRPLGAVTRIQNAAGAGPRHLAFHPNGRWLYCVNEINCTVSLFLWRPHGEQPAAELVPDATVSIRPPGSHEDPPSTGAEVAFSRDGRFLYTSTRFCDVLTVFSVDPQHGRLTQVQQIPCGGQTPRFFALDPSERWLLCANQDSNTITVFRRDAGTGLLQPTGAHPATNPECLLWL